MIFELIFKIYLTAFYEVVSISLQDAKVQRTDEFNKRGSVAATLPLLIKYLPSNF